MKSKRNNHIKSKMKMDHSIFNLKNEIKYKFRTIRKFVELSKLPKNHIMSVLSERISENKKDEMTKIVWKSVHETETKPDINRIDDEQREKIRQFIRIHYDTMTSFCSKHPQFNPSYISKVINGQKKVIDYKLELLLNIIRKESKKHEHGTK